MSDLLAAMGVRTGRVFVGIGRAVSAVGVFGQALFQRRELATDRLRGVLHAFFHSHWKRLEASLVDRALASLLLLQRADG